MKETRKEPSVKRRLEISARIARQMYDAETALMDIFRGAAAIAPELKVLEQERERRRYQRQEETVLQMTQEAALAKDIDLTKARDILWTFTGKDLYRMLVIEKGWSSDDYETWLAQQLIRMLIKS